MSRRDIDSRGAFLEPECCGCLPLKWMQNWFHASTHCSSPWIDRWWLSLVCAEGDYIDLCCIVTQWCVQVSVLVYLHVCVHRRVHVSTSLSLNLSVWRQFFQRLERGRVYCCIQSTSLPEVSMETEKVKVWPEVSREFRRDREKDFVLPHKDSLPQLNMAEMTSK